MVIGYCKEKKKELYIMYVDFSKAYDKVPRYKLLEELKTLGCGSVMLRAIKALYSSTKFILSDAIINFNTGVLQGASTSCLLFTLYLDRMIKMIKAKHPTDGFLGELGVMLLMDDTVLLATSREKLIDKYKTLLQYCSEFGMVVNQAKTKFMVINGTDEDCESISLTHRQEDICLHHTDQYIYLGAPFTSDGNPTTAIKVHVQNSIKHMNKLIAFLQKNSDLPFVLKKKVLDACFMSSIAYAGEAWLHGKTKSLETLYIKAIKATLGVRNTTCTDLCLVELSYPTFQAFLLERRRMFFKKKMNELDAEDPLKIALDLCENGKTKGFLAVQEAVSLNEDQVEKDIMRLKREIEEKAPISSRRQFYMVINPKKVVHNIYSMVPAVPVHFRIQFTRLRLVFHSLRIETGRWSRLERRQRTCICGSAVQDENHVLFDCIRTENIRNHYSFTSFNNLFDGSKPVDTCVFIYKILKSFENT
jgi:hypothetical protein